VIIDRQVAGADKEHLFRNATAFVLASISENMGNTVLEAMARARPVVVSRSAGVAEIVLREDCGLVCDPDAAALAGSLAEMISNPVRAEEMGRRGAMAIAQRYGWPAIGARMADAYRELLARRKAA
jgi:glycosyltransferase involved in cell wall biosynthesis